MLSRLLSIKHLIQSLGESTNKFKGSAYRNKKMLHKVFYAGKHITQK